MALRKKQSEGIALLSMYYDDEEEDEEMGDVDGEGGEGGQEPLRDDDDDDDRRELRSVEDASMADSDRVLRGDSGDDENTPREVVGGDDISVATPGKAQLRPPTPQMSQAMNSDSVSSRRGKLAIVDYGHDEVTMSPEPEEGEIERGDRITLGTDRQSANGDFHDKTPPLMVQVLTPSSQATPQSSDPSQSDKVNHAVNDSEVGDAAIAISEKGKDIDPFDRFLPPPPPKAKCSEELQRKINKFLDYKKAGKSFNAEVRNRKDYRNPDFLLHAVRYQDIDQIGSCFSKDVFNPHGYDKSDYYDEIEADMKREMERKEQERKKNQKVEFLSVGTQPGIAVGATKINLPVPGVSTAAVAGLHSAVPSADTIPRDGRQNKKSKWDKVDSDRRNPLPSGVQDPTLVVGAQTTASSAVNAGAGYMAFAQQRRREAEEKRSSDRKLERRS